jgi:hypothetical protein
MCCNCSGSLRSATVGLRAGCGIQRRRRICGLGWLRFRPRASCRAGPRLEPLPKTRCIKAPINRHTTISIGQSRNDPSSAGCPATLPAAPGLGCDRTRDWTINSTVSDQHARHMEASTSGSLADGHCWRDRVAAKVLGAGAFAAARHRGRVSMPGAQTLATGPWRRHRPHAGLPWRRRFGGCVGRLPPRPLPHSVSAARAWRPASKPHRLTHLARPLTPLCAPAPAWPEQPSAAVLCGDGVQRLPGHGGFRR